MTVMVARRADLTVEAAARVAREGERVRVADAARERMLARRRSFVALVEQTVAQDPDARIYGVTVAPGDGATALLTDEVRARLGLGLWTATSFGPPLPERVTRTIVFARLANLVEGHAGVRPELADAVAALLDSAPLPPVPAHGNGGAGEILALGHLFGELSRREPLEFKEGMALLNGSPGAAALVTDAALCGRGRLALAEQVAALCVEALDAPLEAYAADLEALWEDEHEIAALRSLRGLLEGAGSRRQRHQAAVSLRILPRVLGQARRAQAAAEACATTSLRSVTDNPVYVPGDDARPLGAVLSNGGYHNAWAPAAIDGLARSWAELCQLAERHAEKLAERARSGPDGTSVLASTMFMVLTGWAEEARTAAQPSVLPLGGSGQNDTSAPSFMAWQRAEQAGACLDGALAGLAVAASQSLWREGRPVAAPLTPLLEQVRAECPPRDDDGSLGPLIDGVRRMFAGRAVGREVQSVGA